MHGAGGLETRAPRRKEDRHPPCRPQRAPRPRHFPRCRPRACPARGPGRRRLTRRRRLRRRRRRHHGPGHWARHRHRHRRSRRRCRCGAHQGRRRGRRQRRSQAAGPRGRPAADSHCCCPGATAPRTAPQRGCRAPLGRLQPQGPSPFHCRSRHWHRQPAPNQSPLASRLGARPPWNRQPAHCPRARRCPRPRRCQRRHAEARQRPRPARRSRCGHRPSPRAQADAWGRGHLYWRGAGPVRARGRAGSTAQAQGAACPSHAPCTPSCNAGKSHPLMPRAPTPRTGAAREEAGGARWGASQPLRRERGDVGIACRHRRHRCGAPGGARRRHPAAAADLRRRPTPAAGPGHTAWRASRVGERRAGAAGVGAAWARAECRLARQAPLRDLRHGRCCVAAAALSRLSAVPACSWVAEGAAGPATGGRLDAGRGQALQKPEIWGGDGRLS
jgi:hypothetical protein